MANEFFIKYGVRSEIKVNSNQRYSNDLQQGRLEIPCMFFVSSAHEHNTNGTQI